MGSKQMYREPQLFRTTLSCGLRVVLEQTDGNVAYCGYAIDAGTRDEDEAHPGMAHFIEHMLFKGTSKRKAWHILNRMENVGGELNAYTNKEETVVYSVFLVECMQRAVELLTDLVFHSTFPQHEIQKEIEVIIDEINSYEDSPAGLIFDEFENMIFDGHALGHNILGEPDRLRTYTTSDALNFTHHFYRPDNAVFFVRGNITFKQLVRMLEKCLEMPVSYPSLPEAPLYLPRVAPAPYVASRQIRTRDTHQVHAMVGSRAYPMQHPQRLGLFLLNNVIGGPGMNSLLNVSLREHHGLVYTVESNLTGYTDTGIFNIYFGCDAIDVERCIELTCKELLSLCTKAMSTARLHAAKKQLIGQIGVATDNHENNILGLGKAYLHYNRCEAIPEICRRIEALTSSQLLDIANEIFHPDLLSVLIYTGNQ